MVSSQQGDRIRTSARSHNPWRIKKFSAWEYFYIFKQTKSCVTCWGCCAGRQLCVKWTCEYKSIFLQPVHREAPVPDNKKPHSPKTSQHCTPAAGQTRAYFYCHKLGHLISTYPSFEKKRKKKGSDYNLVSIVKRHRLGLWLGHIFLKGLCLCQ